jgi:hypothetical protein
MAVEQRARTAEERQQIVVLHWKFRGGGRLEAGLCLDPAPTLPAGGSPER